jgi:hypothetical protein
LLLWLFSRVPECDQCDDLPTLRYVQSLLDSLFLEVAFQQEPTPIAQAAITMFCNAILVSTTDHSLSLLTTVCAHPTTATGESFMNLFQRPAENSLLFSSSVSTIRWKGCKLFGEGAVHPLLGSCSRPLSECLSFHIFGCSSGSTQRQSTTCT